MLLWIPPAIDIMHKICYNVNIIRYIIEVKPMYGKNIDFLILLGIIIVDAIIVLVLQKIFEWNVLTCLLAIFGLSVLSLILREIICCVIDVVRINLPNPNSDSTSSMIKLIRNHPSDEQAINKLENVLRDRPAKIRIIAVLVAAYLRTSKIQAAFDLLQRCNEKTAKKKIVQMRQRLLSIEELELDESKSEDWNQLTLLPNLKKLTISQVNQLTFDSSLMPCLNITHFETDINSDNFVMLEKFRNLTGLRYCADIDGDISALSELTNLTELDLSDSFISDISPLRTLTKLKKLDLSYNDIEDISPLISLTNLEWLDLSFNYSIKDYSPLEALHNLSDDSPSKYKKDM